MARTFKPKLASGHRSRMEQRVADDLDARGVSYGYEILKVSYTVPERATSYRPDFNLANGIIIECKGWPFEAKDRVKHLLIKEQHPDLDIRFLFDNPNARISSQSVTTYGDWCNQHGFKYAAKTVPDEWIKEDTSRGLASGEGTSTKKKRSSSRTSGSTKPTSRSRKQAS